MLSYMYIYISDRLFGNCKFLSLQRFVFVTAKHHGTHVGAQVQSQSSQCGICGGKRDAATGFFKSTFLIPYSIILQMV